MALQILYIPGFGQHDDYQIRLLKKWAKKGIQTRFEPINWSDDEPYEAKFKRVIDCIDELAAKHGKISLVGVSAGGSLTMNAYSARKAKISGVVFICGKLSNAQGVGQRFFRANPAFKKSIYDSQANLSKLTDEDRRKMLTLRSAYDWLIPSADSQIPGAKNKVLPFIIHIPTIFTALTIFKNRTINFLKAQAE